MRWRSGAARELDTAATRLAERHTERTRAELLRHRVHLPAALPDGARLAQQAAGEVPADAAPAEVYAAAPSGRMVVLAGPVSGKTVFLLRLALAPAAEGRVPFVLPVAGWDPARRDLPEWIAARLVVDFPDLFEPGPRGTGLARRLVAAGRVLPLLDGLHELPPPARGAALDHLNAYPGPFVLTGDPDHHREPVAGTVAVQLRQLRLTELDEYRRTTRPPDDDTNGAPPVTGDDDTAGRELLDRTFSTAYGPDSPYPPGSARGWLAFLADGRLDIRWWQLPSQVRPAPAAAIGALVAAAVFEAGIWPAWYLCQWLAPGFAGDLRRAMDTTVDAASFGLGGVASPLTVTGHLRWLAVAGAVGALLWAAGTRRRREPPKRRPGRRIGNRATTLAGVRKGTLWGVYLAGVELGAYLLRIPEEAWRLSDEMLARHGIRLTAGVIVLIVAGIVAVAAVIGAVAGALRRAPGTVVAGGPQLDPVAGMRANRWICARIVLAAAGLFAVIWPPYVMYLQYAYGAMPSRPGTAVAAVLGAVLGATTGTLVAAVSQPWPQFTAARLYLAARGRLPLRLLRFLDDARDRQVLSLTGGVYTFRDPAVRDRLEAHR